MAKLQTLFTLVFWLNVLSSTSHSGVVGDEANEIKLQDLLVQQELEICSYFAEHNELAQSVCGSLCNIMKYDDGFCSKSTDCLCRNLGENFN